MYVQSFIGSIDAIDTKIGPKCSIKLLWKDHVYLQCSFTDRQIEIWEVKGTVNQ